MAKYKYLLGLLLTISLITIYISCDKNMEKSTKLQDESVQFRSEGDLLDLLGTACVPDHINVGYGCNDTLWIDTLIINNHPQYPGCSFKIIFNRRNCSYDVFTDVTIGDFQIIDHDCPQFSQDINSYYNQSIWSSYIIDFETNMWNSIRDHIISEYVTGNNFLCGQGYFWNIYFIRASCVQYASIATGKGLSAMVKLACGSQCCERHTRVCRNADGTLNITQYDVTNPFTIDCSDPAFLTDPPLWFKKTAVQWITPCEVTCPN